MRRKKFAGILLLVSVAALVFLSGCGQTHTGDDLEEPEITVEYLSGEFADQILRDGGEKELGAIRIEDEGDGKYALTVESMVIVESSYSKSGYYVADKNISTKVPLDSEARVTYIKDKKKGPEVIELDEFIKKAQKDAKTEDFSDPDSEKLYDVYIIGGNALMLLAKEMPDGK
ncbi:hypothetical protein NE619_10760 [Anaerovorax odorimutans]|uniref:Lipoprotein n=1 Tax=Anaerovorax odorimutans TaxID=109327 RepID=A0ABT1RPS9_9FIRM|nr:hypothetical protein [Anaerovorax odorimutans]MCQ4637204.1 hypothetical protein [Anaerovorax odorimutans]